MLKENGFKSQRMRKENSPQITKSLEVEFITWKLLKTMNKGKEWEMDPFVVFLLLPINVAF